MTKVKVFYNCGDEPVLMSLKEFETKFNNEEINSATELIEFVEE